MGQADDIDFDALSKELNSQVNEVVMPAAKAPASKPPQENYAKSAVRTCNEVCGFRKKVRGQEPGCEYFKRKEVKDGQPCLFEINLINKITIATIDGDTAPIKEFAGMLQGAMFVSLFEMIMQLRNEGLTREEPIMDSRGNPILIYDRTLSRDIPATRIVEHPLISRINQAAKTLGVDLTKFRLTPEAAGDKPQVGGNIFINNADISIEAVIQQSKDELKKFEEENLRAVKDLNEDPVYNRMKGEQPGASSENL